MKISNIINLKLNLAKTQFNFTHDNDNLFRISSNVNQNSNRCYNCNEYIPSATCIDCNAFFCMPCIITHSC